MDGVQISGCHIETDRRWWCLYGPYRASNMTALCYIITQIILNSFRMFQYIYIIRNNVTLICNNVTRFGFILRVLPQLGVRVRQYVAHDVIVLSFIGVHIRTSILLTNLQKEVADRAEQLGHFAECYTTGRRLCVPTQGVALAVWDFDGIGRHYYRRHHAPK